MKCDVAQRPSLYLNISQTADRVKKVQTSFNTISLKKLTHTFILYLIKGVIVYARLKLCALV